MVIALILLALQSQQVESVSIAFESVYYDYKADILQAKESEVIINYIKIQIGK